MGLRKYLSKTLSNKLTIRCSIIILANSIACLWIQEGSDALLDSCGWSLETAAPVCTGAETFASSITSLLMV
jgi:hypothetical protein